MSVMKHCFKKSTFSGLVRLTLDSAQCQYDRFDLTLLHAQNKERYPFLLESVAKGELGRFDILFALPQETIQLNEPAEATDFIAQVNATLNQHLDSTLEKPADLPVMGGWFAYFSYDYVQVIEPKLNLPPSQFPLASLTRVPAAIIVDHVREQLSIVVESSYQEALPELQQDVEQCLLNSNKVETKPIAEVSLHALFEEDEPKYTQGVEAIKDYILAGDVFQVNLSRQWQAKVSATTDYLQVYRALRHSNPAPFAALATFNGSTTDPHQAWQVLSSSPERLVKYQTPWVETRPIAGTRKRGKNLAADQALIDELIAHPKERAEHIMLIDLERNDLGKICQAGSVEVNELMGVETYEHVHHIVSNVRGKLQSQLTPLDIIHALFPGGTITGCPKIRCMEIIAELEKMPREAYTGSLGYINLDGSLDMNILIRTLLQYKPPQPELTATPAQAIVEFRAGAGIVADSQASEELTESRHKAKGLIKAFSQPQP